MNTVTQQIQHAADWIKNAEALVIHAGAGMGVDSGLADYRGEGGQWGAVESANNQPIFEIVNPKNFLENPDSWKLFGQRIKEYATTEPHDGFQLLLQ